MSRYQESLSKLEATSAVIERGKPVRDAELRALEAELPSRLESSYVEFLRSVGALRITTELPGFFADLRIFGHAADERMDVRRASAAMAQSNDDWWWGRPVQPIIPVIGYGVNSFPDNPFGDEGYVLHQGSLHHIHRGQLDPRDGTFSGYLADILEELLRALEEQTSRRLSGAALAGQLIALLGDDAIVATDEGAVWRIGERALTLKLSGFDYRDEDPGLFATWDETGLDLDAVNARNLSAHLACGTLGDEGVTHFRARLLARELPVESFVAALAHDLRHPLALTVPDGPSLEAIHHRLETHPPWTREERLTHALLGITARERDEEHLLFAREGDALVGRSAYGKGGEQAAEVHISVGPTGLLEVEHRRSLEPAKHTLEAVNATNRVRQLDLPDAYIRVFVDDDELGFAFTSTRAALDTKVFANELLELERKTRF